MRVPYKTFVHVCPCDDKGTRRLPAPPGYMNDAWRPVHSGILFYPSVPVPSRLRRLRGGPGHVSRCLHFLDSPRATVRLLASRMRMGIEPQTLQCGQRRFPVRMGQVFQHAFGSLFL